MCTCTTIPPHGATVRCRVTGALGVVTCHDHSERYAVAQVQWHLTSRRSWVSANILEEFDGQSPS